MGLRCCWLRGGPPGASVGPPALPGGAPVPAPLGPPCPSGRGAQTLCGVRPCSGLRPPLFAPAASAPPASRRAFLRLRRRGGPPALGLPGRAPPAACPWPRPLSAAGFLFGRPCSRRPCPRAACRASVASGPGGASPRPFLGPSAPARGGCGGCRSGCPRFSAPPPRAFGPCVRWFRGDLGSRLCPGPFSASGAALRLWGFSPAPPARRPRWGLRGPGARWGFAPPSAGPQGPPASHTSPGGRPLPGRPPSGLFGPVHFPEIVNRCPSPPPGRS